MSRFAFPINSEGHKLLYSSRLNNFYEVSDALFGLLNSPERYDKLSEEFPEEFSLLRDKKILVADGEDDEYVDSLRLRYLLGAFRSNRMSLTLLPSLGCNLACPYCFEGDKRNVSMTEEVCDRIVDFVKAHDDVEVYHITWFGGEPLLNPKAIRRVLEGLKGLEDKKLGSHSIVTNATLLNRKAIEIFTEFPLTSLQVTLDGLEPAHNRKRFYRNGGGTFADILDNIDRFTKECPDTHVNFRINLDLNNCEEYEPLKLIVEERFSGRSVSVYSALLRKTPGCDTLNFFTPRDAVNFYLDLYRKINVDALFPSHCSKGCIATNPRGYVIGPEGELHRCWEHVGKPELEVGNITTARLTNEKLFQDFILHGHCLDDDKCRRCGFLPICSGGCPKKRVEALRGEGDGGTLCDILSADGGEGLNRYLSAYYNSLKTQSE